MTAAAEDCDVLVADHGVDALVVERADRRPLLIVRQGPSHGAAVAAIMRVAPRSSRDKVKHLVRKHLPDALDLDEMLPSFNPATVQPPATHHSPSPIPLRPILLPVAVVLGLLCVGFVSIHADAETRLSNFRAYRSAHQIVADATAHAAPTSGQTKAPTTRAGAKSPYPHALERAKRAVRQKGAPSDGGPPAGAVAHGSGPLLVLGPDDHGSFDVDDPLLKDCPRSVLDTLAVAYLRDGPTSSTSTSNTVRLAPSLVSYDLALSLPCTITRMPRCKDSAAFSAACRQTEQSRASTSPSTHSLRDLSKVRGVDMTRKLATAAPDGVKRSSGSAAKLPISVMGVSPAKGPSPSAVGGLVGTTTGTVSGLTDSLLGG